MRHASWPVPRSAHDPAHERTVLVGSFVLGWQRERRARQERDEGLVFDACR